MSSAARPHRHAFALMNCLRYEAERAGSTLMQTPTLGLLSDSLPLVTMLSCHRGTLLSTIVDNRVGIFVYGSLLSPLPH